LSSSTFSSSTLSVADLGVAACGYSVGAGEELSPLGWSYEHGCCVFVAVPWSDFCFKWKSVDAVVYCKFSSTISFAKLASVLRRCTKFHERCDCLLVQWQCWHSEARAKWSLLMEHSLSHVGCGRHAVGQISDRRWIARSDGGMVKARYVIWRMCAVVR